MGWMFAAMGTAFCFGLNNTLFKWSAVKGLSRVTIQFFFYLTAFVLVAGYGVLQGTLHPNLITILLGSLIGILNANGNLQMTRAFEKGPASITSTLIAMNSLVVIFATAMFFPETIPLVHWAGIVLMIAAAFLVQLQPANNKQFEYRPWLFSCLYSLLSIGLVGFLLKVSTYYHIDFLGLLASMYGGGLLFLGYLLRKDLGHLYDFKLEIKVAVIVGLLSIIGYSCYLFALDKGPASIVFPVISLSSLVVMVAGIVVFKERLKPYQILGMAVALAGLVLTKL